MVIAAAAIAKSAVAIPIEIGPAAPSGGWRLALSCRDGGAKPAVAAGGAGLRCALACHLGVAPRGCFNWAAPRAAAAAAMLTEWVRMGGIQPAAIVQHVGATMHRFRMRFLTAALGAAMLFVANPSFAQNSEQKPGEKPGDKPQAGDAKEAQKKIDEFAEAEKLLGGPAANPEFLWLGRRVVSLFWHSGLGAGPPRSFSASANSSIFF